MLEMSELAENASGAESSAEEDDEVEWQVNPPPPGLGPKNFIGIEKSTIWAEKWEAQCLPAGPSSVLRLEVRGGTERDATSARGTVPSDRLRLPETP